jgi:gamma-glutamyltranspeptidase/glutathione hydrolase
MNVCPALGAAGDRHFALGASGGRKIVGAVVQLASFLTDFGMDLQAAFDQPRIDVSGGERIVADAALAPAVIEALTAVSSVSTARGSMLPYPFACPAGVMTEGARQFGMTEPMTAWGDAVRE